jgi:hypothetical protein
MATFGCSQPEPSGVRLADECQPANATTFLEIGLASNLVSSLGRQLPIHMQKKPKPGFSLFLRLFQSMQALAPADSTTRKQPIETIDLRH